MGSKTMWTMVLALAVLTASAVPLDKDESQYNDLGNFKYEMEESLATGNIRYFVEQMIQDLSIADLFTTNEHEVLPEEEHSEKSLAFCSMCSIGADEIIHLVNNGASLDVVFNASVVFCVALNISTPSVCEGIIEMAKPQVSWLLLNTEGLTGNDFCGMIFSGNDCKSKNPERVWEVNITDTPKPLLVDPVIPQNGPTLKVLHLADTHFDPDYTPGTNALCLNHIFCCRPESGPLQHPTDAAGYWGDYRYCDAPRWTLEAIYTHINQQHPDISFIIWTGDLVPHNIWNTSRENNLNIIRESVAMVQEYFPGIPVFPALGNHESDPVNAFPQPYIDNEFDISWLYEEIADLWKTWLPTEVAETITYSGYYVTQVFPDLRILSVNTNYCYALNWWLLYDSVDPGQVLDWMSKELQRAEDDNVYVYIISHIPSGHDDCSFTWSHQYNKLIARYEGVIAGIFYGHTHKDHYQIFFDPEDTQRPIEVGFVAQSQTPYSELNCGYKVYSIDGGRDNATYTVLDHENWFFDLDAANAENGQPDFQVLYTAKEEYGLSDLSPQSLLDLVFEMAVDESPKFDLFYRNYYKAGRPRLETLCDAACKHTMLCELLVADTSDKTICKQLP